MAQRWIVFQKEYRKNNPGTSMQDAGVVWRELKKGVQTSVTIMTLPIEVGEYMSQFLRDHCVAKLQRTTKWTRRITQKRLLALYNTLPTYKEVNVYLRDRIVMPVTTRVDLLNFNMTRSTITQFNGQLILTHWQTNSKSVRVESSYLETVNALIDPTTMLATMYRRKRHSDDEHCVRIVKTYIRNALMCLLPRLVAKEYIDALFAAKERNIHDESTPLIPVPKGDDERNKYVRTIASLKEMCAWIGGVDESTTFVMNDTQLTRRCQKTLFDIFFAYKLLQTRASTLFDHIKVTTKDVLEYIQQQLDVGKPVKVAFYSVVSFPRPDNEKQDELNTSVFVLDMVTKNEGTYTQYKLGEEREMTSHPISGPNMLQHMLRTKTVPGIVDPFTFKALYRSDFLAATPQGWLLSIVGDLLEEFELRPANNLSLTQSDIQEQLLPVGIGSPNMRMLILYTLWSNKSTDLWLYSEKRQHRLTVEKELLVSSRAIRMLFDSYVLLE